MKKVRLLRDVRPFGRTGEAVEVSPEHCEWLTSLGMAVEVEEAGEQAAKPEPDAVLETAQEKPKTVKKPAKAAGKKKE